MKRETAASKTGSVDLKLLRVLLKSQIKMDFRGHKGLNQPQGKKLSPLWWSVIFYFLMSFGLAGGLVSVATPFLYSLLVLSYAMVMTVFSVMLEFGNTIINPDDGDILGFRPINSRTYFLARLLNLFFYVWIVTTALCLVPALLGMAVKGMPLWFPLVFYPVALLADLTAAAFVVWVYTGLLQIMPYEKFKDFLAHLQIVFSFLVFFSYQLVPRLAGTFLQDGQDITETWLYFAPPAWFAGAVQLLLNRARDMDAVLGATALTAMVLLSAAAFRKISVNYAHRIANLQSAGGGGRKQKPLRAESPAPVRSAPFLNRLLGSPASLAGYYLTVNMIKRDRTVKMSVYPLLGMPFAFIALAILDGKLADPFTEGVATSSSYGTMVIFFIFFMAYSLFNVMLYAGDWQAAWIFQAAPVFSPGRVFYGLKVAVYLRALCPFFAVLFVVYALNIGALHAFQLVLLFAGFGHISLSMAALLVKDYPFSKPRQRGERSKTFAALLIIAPVFALVMVLFSLLRIHTGVWWLYMIFIIPASLGIEKLVQRRVDKRLKGAF